MGLSCGLLLAVKVLLSAGVVMLVLLGLYFSTVAACFWALLGGTKVGLVLVSMSYLTTCLAICGVVAWLSRW